MPHEHPAIGIDVGGQSVRVGLVLGARVLHVERFDTPATYDGFQAELTERITELREREDVLGVGLGLPGRFDPRSHIVERALNLPWLEGHTPDADLANRIGLPVVMASDVGAAAVGQRSALPAPPRRFLYLSLGTGVGGALVVNGALQDLSTDGPAHFGHILVDTTDMAPECTCGARGCLEACVRGPALQDPALRATAPRRLALGVLQLVHLLRTEVVMLGGGVMDYEPHLLQETLHAWGDRPTTLVPDDFALVGPKLSTDQAGVLGAAQLALA